MVGIKEVREGIVTIEGQVNMALEGHLEGTGVSSKAQVEKEGSRSGNLPRQSSSRR